MVWLNGVHIGNHMGPFLPFRFDVAEALKTGTDNELEILVLSAQAGHTPPNIGRFSCRYLWQAEARFVDHRDPRRVEQLDRTKFKECARKSVGWYW